MKFDWLTRDPPAAPKPPTFDELLALLDRDPGAARIEIGRMDIRYAAPLLVDMLLTLWSERKK